MQDTVQNGYVERRIGGLPEAFVQPPIQQWMTAQKWRAGYTLWQESRHCRNAFNTGENPLVCAHNEIALPLEDECQGAQDGYEFLVMHRYLLQTIRALWPQLEDPFTGWRNFPGVEDYPPLLQSRFYAWPNGVLNKVPDIGNRGGARGHGPAVPLDTDAGRRREQLLVRWKTEGEFGQWLQCGTTQKGLGLDSLYRALITNAVPIGDHQPGAIQPGAIHPMDLYLFWKTHGWIDQLWEDYRSALGKTPEDPKLQADLIQQCRIHHFWAEKAGAEPVRKPTSSSSGPLYQNGELNAEHAGEIVRLLGEVVDIKPGPAGKIFLKLDVRLVGVKPIWVSSFPPMAEGVVRMGAVYEFVGTIEKADALDGTGQVRKFLQSTTLLLVKSLQSPR